MRSTTTIAALTPLVLATGFAGLIDGPGADILELGAPPAELRELDLQKRLVSCALGAPGVDQADHHRPLAT
jgi:hypothetical protein